jgi:hypothetical protein
MTNDLNSTFSGDLGALPVDALLPERPAIIGEFSPAYETFKTATLYDLEPMNDYELVLALQLVDLNWAILQRKASADIELFVGTEKKKIRSEVRDKLYWKGRREYQRLLEEFEAQGGDGDDFKDPIGSDAISNRVD